MSAAENFPSRVLLSNEEQSEEAGVAAGAQGLGEAANVPPGGASASAYNILPRTLFSMLRRLELQSLLPHAALDRDRLRPLGWHPRGCRVAVLVNDLVEIHTVDPSTQKSDGRPERLAHAGVKDVAVITWRPMAKNFLALAHASGVCLWTCDSVSAPALAVGIRGLAAPSSWRRTTLQYGKLKQSVASLCWSPCGQYLAAGSPQDSAFAVWDIATRVCTRLRSGMAGARLLRWSPLGNYLLVAGFDQRGFEIWETHTWTCQSWSTGARALTDATWSADEAVVLIALDASSQLGVLHLVGSAPSLLAHLLPLDLPKPLGDVLPDASWSAACISSLAYDSIAGKLAVACSLGVDIGTDAPRHLVCVYGVESSPVYVAKLRGSVHPPAAQARPAPRCKLQVALRPVDGQKRSIIAITWPDESVALASV